MKNNNRLGQPFYLYRVSGINCHDLTVYTVSRSTKTIIDWADLSICIEYQGLTVMT